MLENEDYEIVPDDEMIDNLELEKKNLASLAAHNMFPEKRLLKAPKARPLILGKRDSDDLEILENGINIIYSLDKCKLYNFPILKFLLKLVILIRIL